MIAAAIRSKPPRELVAPRVARHCVVGVLLALGLAGCTTGFVYNRLDWVVSWYVNGMVSLDDAQERMLRDSVHRTMDWHRQSQLPAYIVLLEEMAEETSAPVSAARLEERYRQVSIFLDDFIRRVNPDVAALLRTLSSTQVAELEDNIEDDNEELWEEYAGVTPEIRHRRRVRSAVRAMQRFTGRLTTEQRDFVATRLAGMHDVSHQWLERRRHWQERFVGLLRAPPAGADLEAALLDLVLHPDQFDTPEYRLQVEANRRIIMAMIADLSVSTSPRQRDHLGRKFREYAEDLRRIAAHD